jgi:hypothetical protein
MKRCAMTESLDIFAINGNDCLWIGCAASIEDAVGVIRRHKGPDTFLVLSQITRHRTFYRVGLGNEVVQLDGFENLPVL